MLICNVVHTMTLPSLRLFEKKSTHIIITNSVYQIGDNKYRIMSGEGNVGKILSKKAIELFISECKKVGSLTFQFTPEAKENGWR